MTASRRRSGAALVELLVSAIPLSLAATGTLGGLLLVALRFGLDAEAYTLARAHAYGNRRALCAASTLASTLVRPGSALQIDASCDGQGTVELAARYHERLLVSRRWDLRRGRQHSTALTEVGTP